MQNDSWSESYRKEIGDDDPDGREGPDISPGVMSRGPVADEVQPSLGAETKEEAAGHEPMAEDSDERRRPT